MKSPRVFRHTTMSGRNRVLLFITATLIASFIAGCRASETYPARPITLLCPWAVGGGTDRVSRQMAAFLEHELGVPVNVVNATGGAGVTGHSRGAGAVADGYTVTMMTVELNMLHWRELTDISWDDFTPVALLNRDPAALFVRAEETRWGSAGDVIESVRRGGGNLTASGTAVGGIWHLALGGMLSRAGVSPAAVKWVPAGGAGPALQELASGGVDLVVCSLPEARTLLVGGRVRSLGVMADKRIESYPDVPTLKEQGIDWSIGGWRGVGVPKGTPTEVVATLSQALERISTGETMLNNSRFPDYMANEGFNVSWQSPEEFRATLAETDNQLGALLTAREFASVNTSAFTPMKFPALLFAALGLTLAALLVSSYKGIFFGRDSAPLAAAPRGENPEADTMRTRGAVSREGLIHFAEFVLAVALFAVLAETVGFILTASMLLFFLLVRMGTRVWVSALVTLLLVPAVYSFFGTLMRVPLARGLFGW
ncbi:MAG TPA: tripartite tricarboxylate transporter substrate-binding protein [Pyrinomonadaceae bacterium]|nr:tripartite tricarboxylate transporter substrate-binding protein [Pyrinomonadaceae bacterium]